MPIIAGALAWLLTLVPAFVAKVLVSLGVGIVSYTGVSLLLGRLTTAVLNNAGAISGDIGAFLNLAGLDVCFSMVLSALSMRLALQTTNGVINKVSFTNKSLTT